MEKLICKLCNKEFKGRLNQIFCSIECKNKYYNEKTRLIYHAGKYGKDAFEQILNEQGSKNERMKKALAVFNEKEKWFDAEIEKLKSDYKNLLQTCNNISEQVEKLKRNTLNTFSEKQQFEAQMKLAEGIGQFLKPLVTKIINKLDSMEEKKKE